MIPTSIPTFSPPIVISLSVEGSAISNTTFMKVNPTSKLTIKSQWSSSDVLTSFGWAVHPLDADEDLNLERGVTTSTAITNEFLVLKPSVLLEGASYTFRMTATNRYGKLHSGTINVTAGRPPSSGMLVSVPLNGTALRDAFHLSTGNWTNDDISFPLVYKFFYMTSEGESVNLREFSTSTNLSSTLPLGHSGGHYGLPVGVYAQDYIEATASLNMTLTVVPPSLTTVLSVVSEATSDVSDLLDAGDSDTALVLIQASASVLNLVLESTSDDDGSLGDDGNGNFSSAILRSDLIVHTLDIASDVEDTAGVESAAVCIESLTSVAPASMAAEDQLNALDAIVALANASAALASVSSTAATASILAISNLITGGVLTTSTAGSTTDTTNEALAQLNSALTVTAWQTLRSPTSYCGA